jgi:hypothetical protein
MDYGARHLAPEGIGARRVSGDFGGKLVRAGCQLVGTCAQPGDSR